MRFAGILAAVAVVSGVSMKARTMDDDVVSDLEEVGVVASTIEDMMTEQLGDTMGGVVADQIISMAQDEGVEMLTD